MLVIRAYDPSDRDALVAIDARVGTETTRLPLLLRAHAAQGFWLAEQGGRVVGYIARTFEFFDKDFIALVVVDETLRRSGIGTALMRKIENLATGDRIFTSTNESNATMRAVLARLGYVPSGRIDNLDPGDPELVFVKFLKR
ncbi:MAG TPA: GNAT family N-acetyltransferase [Rhizomicrobium sp.]